MLSLSFWLILVDEKRQKMKLWNGPLIGSVFGQMGSEPDDWYQNRPFTRPVRPGGPAAGAWNRLKKNKL